jgi:hypothetical protein
LNILTGQNQTYQNNNIVWMKSVNVYNFVPGIIKRKQRNITVYVRCVLLLLGFSMIIIIKYTCEWDSLLRKWSMLCCRCCWFCWLVCGEENVFLFLLCSVRVVFFFFFMYNETWPHLGWKNGGVGWSLWEMQSAALNSSQNFNLIVSVVVIFS